jgi:ACT domain-containing protein
MKAVVTVIGHDRVGILAKASGACAEANANVIEVNQSVMQEFFTMVMLVDITELRGGLSGLEDALKAKLPEMEIHVMHEDIFNAMHRV